MARPKSYDARLRSRLIADAARVIASGGPGAVSLRALAASASTSTSAVYSLFGSKAGLVQAVLGEAEASFTQTQRAAPTSADPVTDIRVLGLAYRDWALDHPALYAVMFGGRVEGRAPQQGAGGTGGADGAVEPSIAPLTEVIGRLIGAGTVRAVPVDRVARSVWAGVHGMVSLEIAEGIPEREERAAPYMEHLEVILRGWGP